jgi:hypothetical protein
MRANLGLKSLKKGIKLSADYPSAKGLMFLSLVGLMHEGRTVWLMFCLGLKT